VAKLRCKNASETIKHCVRVNSDSEIYKVLGIGPAWQYLGKKWRG
jgi:hypothetical protein